MIGMHTFGASAPIKDVMKKFGFTVENIVAAAKQTARQVVSESADWQCLGTGHAT